VAVGKSFTVEDCFGALTVTLTVVAINPAVHVATHVPLKYIELQESPHTYTECHDHIWPGTNPFSNKKDDTSASPASFDDGQPRLCTNIAMAT